MTLIDYPGDLIAALALLLTAAWMIWAFASGLLARLGWKRWGLAVLAWIPIVLAFWLLANPGRIDKKQHERPCTIMALFDTSESMSLDQDQTSRLDQALARFQETFTPGDTDSPNFQYYGFDERCVPVGSLDQLNRWGRQSNLTEAWAMMSPWLSPATQDQVSDISGLIVFTDGQVNQQHPAVYARQENPDIPLLLVGVGSEQTNPDATIAHILAPSYVGLHQAYPATVSVETTALAGQTLFVDLYLNDHLLETKSLPVKQDIQAANVIFNLCSKALGTDVLRAELRASGKETNSRNNSYSQLVQVIPNDNLKVLLYSEVANMDMGKIREALLRDEKIELDFRMNVVKNPARLKGDARKVDLVKLPKTANEINRYDVIILGPIDLQSLPEATIENLYHYVTQRGGALILLPGRESMALSQWRNAKMTSLLPVTFGAYAPPHHSGLRRVSLTDQARADHRFSTLALDAELLETMPAYAQAVKKPAASTWLALDDTPLVCSHRVGRGRVCLLNSPLLFQWYRENEKGGLLRELLASVTSSLGGVKSGESRIDLVSRYDNDHQTVHFEALVRDADYRPAEYATVLLTCNEVTHRMQAVAPGRYQVQCDPQQQRSLLVKVKAERSGIFLGERMMAVNIPQRSDEMTHPQANKAFLKRLAQATGGDYVDIDQLDKQTAKRFAASRIIEEPSDWMPLWHRWSILSLVCGMLILYWFLRRRAGLV